MNLNDFSLFLAPVFEKNPGNNKIAYNSAEEQSNHVRAHIIYVERTAGNKILDVFCKPAEKKTCQEEDY
jgi:hypothetical protein